MRTHTSTDEEYTLRYDKITVANCRDFLKRWKVVDVPEDITDEENLVRRMHNLVTDVALCCYKVELYSKKKRTIEEWKRDDENKDNILEQSEWKFGDVQCLKCGGGMTFDFKDIDGIGSSDHNKVIFAFSCSKKGHAKRVFYDTGKEYIIEDTLCSKCKSCLVITSNRKCDVITTIYTCNNCKHQEVDELTLNKPESDPLFEEDRAKYCLSKEVGDAEMLGAENLKQLSKRWKEQEQNKEVNQKVSNVEKVTILELEKRISQAIEKKGFVRFHFKDPEKATNVEICVPFIVYDENSKRTEKESSYQLKQQLKGILKGTNWRLMTDGVMYRVGMLEGRLRVYSTEQELLKLVS